MFYMNRFRFTWNSCLVQVKYASLPLLHHVSMRKSHVVIVDERVDSHIPYFSPIPADEFYLYLCHNKKVFIPVLRFTRAVLVHK